MPPTSCYHFAKLAVQAVCWTVCTLQVKSGNDDLRQDAVMQQFFWLVNQFLREQPRTQRRNLAIRTYKASRQQTEAGAGAGAGCGPGEVDGGKEGLHVLYSCIACTGNGLHVGAPQQAPAPSRLPAPSLPLPHTWPACLDACFCPQVVPFSPSSGLLEWVENTMPMADFLLGPSRTGGAHLRYKRAGDLDWYRCYEKVGRRGRGGEALGEQGMQGDRDMMTCSCACLVSFCCHSLLPPRATLQPCSALFCPLPLPVQLAKAPQPQMRAAFDEVCAGFPPVMHHFFLENFRDPGERVMCGQGGRVGYGGGANRGQHGLPAYQPLCLPGGHQLSRKPG